MKLFAEVKLVYYCLIYTASSINTPICTKFIWCSYTANSQHICHIYGVGNNLVQIDDNMCTMAVTYTPLLHSVTYLILHYDTYCCYHSVPILTICTCSCMCHTCAI